MLYGHIWETIFSVYNTQRLCCQYNYMDGVMGRSMLLTVMFLVFTKHNDSVATIYGQCDVLEYATYSHEVSTPLYHPVHCIQ